MRLALPFPLVPRIIMSETQSISSSESLLEDADFFPDSSASVGSNATRIKMASAEMGARQLGPEKPNEHGEEKIRALLTRPLTALVFTRIFHVLDGERVEDIGDTISTKCMTTSRNAWLGERVHTDGTFL